MLEQSVVDEDVLFFGLHEVVALRARTAEEAERREGSRQPQLVQLGVQDYVRACATDSRAGKGMLYFRFKLDTTPVTYDWKR